MPITPHLDVRSPSARNRLAKRPHRFALRRFWWLGAAPNDDHAIRTDPTLPRSQPPLSLYQD